MANPLDALFKAANALPAPVPGDTQVTAQCVANLFSPNGQEIAALGPLQFTRATSHEPAFFSGLSFAGPEGDENNSLSFQTHLTLTAIGPGHTAYSLTVKAPIFSQSLSLVPKAILTNGVYSITAMSPQSAFVFLTLFAPMATNF
jgi:hypothetical protein